MIRGTRILAVVALSLLVGAASLLAQSAPQAPVKVNPPPALKSKAGHPPANAGKGTSIGKGKASTTTANAAGDTDSVKTYMTDRWLDDCTISGPAGFVRDEVDAWFESGVSTPIVVPSSTSGGQLKAIEEIFAAYE